MDKDKLKALMETPLDPDLDYFDATPALEAIANHVRGLHELINFLASSITIQHGAIIALRKENIEIKADLFAAGIASTKGESELVGFDEPSIVMPRKN